MIELTLTGSAYDRGLQHGRALAGRIRREVLAFTPTADHQDFRKHPGGVPAAGGAHTISQATQYLAGLFPEIVEEIRGIADGASISFEEVFAFNNRGLLDESWKEGCSHAAITRGGSVVVGMNKDVRNPDMTSYFVKRVLPDMGYAFLGYGHVGRVWGYGVNEKGLCVAGTAAFPSTSRTEFPWVGLYFLGPIVLNKCATIDQAVELIHSLKSVHESGNILLADESGSAAVVEVAPETRIVRKAENQAVYSTNFFASVMIENFSDEAYLVETRARFVLIGELVERFGWDRVEGMKRILAAHADAGSVCRHGPCGDKTVFSWIADVRKRVFLIAPGPPCSTPYLEYALA